MNVVIFKEWICQTEFPEFLIPVTLIFIFLEIKLNIF